MLRLSSVTVIDIAECGLCLVGADCTHLKSYTLKISIVEMFRVHLKILPFADIEIRRIGCVPSTKGSRGWGWWSGVSGRAAILRWRHNGRNSVSNHQPYDCLLNRLFSGRSNKTSKLRVTGLCAGNSPGTGEFPSQMVSNAENASIWWRHHISENVVSPRRWAGPFYRTLSILEQKNLAGHGRILLPLSKWAIFFYLT